MFGNYLQIALRNLGKSKIYSFINISGLAIGITCALLILLWVQDELTYDRWMPKYDKVFRLLVKAQYEGKTNVWNANPWAAVEAIKEEHAAVVHAAALDWGGDHLLAVADKTDRTGIKKNGYYVSDDFLKMFQYPMVSGDVGHALQDMKSIVITRSTAKALFGDNDPMGKVVRFDDQHDLVVTAVLEDVSGNSTIKFDYLVTWQLYMQTPWVKQSAEHWDAFSHQVYIEVTDASQAVAVENKIKDLLTRHGQTDFKKEFMLHPIARQHLYGSFDNGVESGGSITYVRLFSIVAILVLVIACVNFMNLATARSEKRAVEVGVRKSVGSGRADLVVQFIGESILTTAIAFVIGVLLAQVLLPRYNELVSKQLAIPYTSWVFMAVSVGMVIGIGILAGSYPAFYLSAFKPASVLKGGRGSVKGGTLPRKILVTTQFGFSMVLMIATIIVYQQIQHTRDRDIGYNPNNMLIVKVTPDLEKHYTAIKEALLQTGVVDAVTRSNAPITDRNAWGPASWTGMPADQKYFFSIVGTEYDYVKTMGLTLLEGRDFSEEFKSDSNKVIVNRAAAELMGFKHPIGERVTSGENSMEIVGVIENAISGSPAEIPGPMLVLFSPKWFRVMTIRMSGTGTTPASLDKVAAVFKKYSPAYPFDFKYADDAFQQKFTEINLTSRLASIFAALTFFITGLGLFGLAAFTAAQRTKEMGIRKVMGASVQQLVQLVSRDFSILVVIAFVVASPVAWYFVSGYLEQFQYRVSVQWWVFPLVGVLALLFAIIIVSTQALRAARSNPAQSLRE
jgi:putative ABC transport system permease protein